MSAAPAFFATTGPWRIDAFWLLVIFGVSIAVALLWRCSRGRLAGSDGSTRTAQGRFLHWLIILLALAASMFPSRVREPFESPAPRAQVVIVDVSRSRGHGILAREKPSTFHTTAPRLIVIAAGLRPYLLHDGEPGAFQRPKDRGERGWGSPANRAGFDPVAAWSLARSRLNADEVVDLRMATDGGFEVAPSEMNLDGGVSIASISTADPSAAAPENLSLHPMTRRILGEPGRASQMEVEVFGLVRSSRSFVVEIPGGSSRSLTFDPESESMRVTLTTPVLNPATRSVTVRLSDHRDFDPDPSLDQLEIPVLLPERPLRVAVLGDRGPDLLEFAEGEGIVLIAAQGAASLEGADVVIAHDLSADAAETSGLDRALSTFARSGGGVLLAGSRSAFGLGGWRNRPLEKLSPLLSDPGDGPRRFIAALDRSGSMDRDGRFRAASRALQSLYRRLGPEDEMLLLTFAQDLSTARFAPGDEAGLKKRLSETAVRGGTDLAAALDRALSEPPPEDERGRNLLFLLTDGRDAGVLGTAAPKERLESWVRRAAEQKTRIFVFWFDRDESARADLERLTRGTGGQLIDVDDFAGLTRAFLAGASRELLAENQELPSLPDAVTESWTAARILRTGRRSEARILAAASEDLNALALRRHGAGRVAAAPLELNRENLEGLFGDRGGFVSWLRSLSSVEAAGLGVLRRRELDSGAGWVYALEIDRERFSKTAAPPGWLAAGEKRLRLVPRGPGKFESEAVFEDSVWASDPAAVVRILDPSGAPLGRRALPGPDLDDRKHLPQAEAAEALMAAMKTAAPAPRGASIVGSLLLFALCGVVVDLILRALGR